MSTSCVLGRRIAAFGYLTQERLRLFPRLVNGEDAVPPDPGAPCVSRHPVLDDISALPGRVDANAKPWRVVTPDEAVVLMGLSLFNHSLRKLGIPFGCPSLLPEAVRKHVEANRRNQK
jgi:hypothetical protein